MKEKELVRLRRRPSRDGKRFVLLLDYVDENGKRKRVSLGHADSRKADRQRAQKERELRMGIVVPGSMKLSDFLEDSLTRTGNQIRESTGQECECAMKHFIKVIGNIDYQRIALKHGELFRQTCLDEGNSPATAAKKLRHLKRLFQLAVDRKQLDENPLWCIKMPKAPKKKVETYTPDECKRILKAARDMKDSVRWDLLIIVALTTAARRGELLNAVWGNIDFEKKTIEVSPKRNTPETWRWDIKDTERRTLPLTEEAVVLLAEHQAGRPSGYPYVFVPPARYDKIQRLRGRDKWSVSDSRLKVINNFGRQFGKILKRAAVREGQFHDLRRTALNSWFANGMSEYDVMTLAGHSSFSTTHKFYLAVAGDLTDRARAAAVQDLAHIWHAPPNRPEAKKVDSHNDLPVKSLLSGQGRI